MRRFREIALAFTAGMLTVLGIQLWNGRSARTTTDSVPVPVRSVSEQSASVVPVGAVHASGNQARPFVPPPTTAAAQPDSGTLPAQPAYPDEDPDPPPPIPPLAKEAAALSQ